VDEVTATEEKRNL